MALFRRTFSLGESVADATLMVFADTRYEAWIDGRWLGRGPARFSHRTRPHDVLPVPSMAPGRHVLAIRVQWAPNLRRSHSTRPHLAARLVESDGRIFVTSDATWRSVESAAWRTDAVPVHALQLIGPSEVLDLRRLPPRWRERGFDDGGWPPAVEVGDAARIGRAPHELDARQTDRTIAYLGRYPIVPNVIATGRLSPGRAIHERPAAQAERIDLTMDRSGDTVTIETLRVPADSMDLGDPRVTAVSTWVPPTATLDGQRIQWRDAGTHRPDVVVASLRLPSGSGTLAFTDPPADGVVFSVTGASVDHREPTGGAGRGPRHPGRLTLLAEPVADWIAAHLPGTAVRSVADRPTVGEGPSAVEIGRTKEGLELQFRAAPAYVVLDLERTRYGRLMATVEGAPGTRLDIGWDERLLDGTARPLPHPGSLHSGWSQVDTWLLDAHPREIATLDARAGRYVLIAAWGPLTLRSLRVEETLYPLPATGWFRSDEPLLDAIWRVGDATARVNATDAYADPWRERGMWWGDAWATDRVVMATAGGDALRRRGLRLMAEPLSDDRWVGFAPRGDASRIIDYAMLWLLALEEQHRLAPDARLVDEAWPAVRAVADGLLTRRAPSGLIRLDRGPWHRTALIDWSAGPDRWGESAALNAMAYGALLSAAEIAEEAGRTADAERWRAAAHHIRSTLWGRLGRVPIKEDRIGDLAVFDGAIGDHPGAGRPAPGGGQRLPGGWSASYPQGLAANRTPEGNAPPSPHAQAWALAYGAIPRHAEHAVADALLVLLPARTGDLPRVEMYGFHWVLEALGRTGRHRAALAAIRHWYGPLLAEGLTTWPESWLADERFASSLSHGWSGAPTVYLTRWLLGAWRTGRGSWRFRPAFSATSFAEGSLPMPEGTLHLRWFRDACRLGVAEVVAPAGSRGVVELPRTPGTTITVDGRRIRIDAGAAVIPAFPRPGGGPPDHEPHSDDHVSLPIEPGRHVITIAPLATDGCVSIGGG